MKINILSEPPKDGAFLSIWEYNGEIFSDSFRWNGDLEIFNVAEDRWKKFYEEFYGEYFVQFK